MNIKRLDDFLLNCQQANITLPTDLVAKIDEYETIIPEELKFINEVEYTTSFGYKINICNANEYNKFIKPK